MEGSMLEEGTRAGMVKRTLGGNCGTRQLKVRGIEGNARGKGSTGLWSQAQAKKQ